MTQPPHRESSLLMVQIFCATAGKHVHLIFVQPLTSMANPGELQIPVLQDRPWLANSGIRPVWCDSLGSIAMV
jgi:hypothetical protein